MDKRIMNIGIFAHVDAGKTSITENLLHRSGSSRIRGYVDAGTSHSDSMDIERKRGISVKSACLGMSWKDVHINLIDTPGHTDFSPEAERGLRVTDAAILVISAVEGVQAHTFSIWEALKKRHIPCLFFINKIDRAGASYDECLHQLQNELGAMIFTLQTAVNEEQADADSISLWANYPEQAHPLIDKSIENLAEINDVIMEYFLEDKVPDKEELLQTLAQECKKGKIAPVLCGSAKNGNGMQALLDAMISYLPVADASNELPASAYVFRTEFSKNDGILAHIRLFSGTLKTRDSIRCPRNNTEIRISRLMKDNGGKTIDIEEVNCGDTAIIVGSTGLSTGDELGEIKNIPEASSINISVMTTAVKAKNEGDYYALSQALTELNTQEPSLNFDWRREEKELHISILGKIQTEIIESLLHDKYGIAVEFEEPQIVYKESPVNIAEADVRYTMPKPCWAVMRFRIEPTEEGSGITYESKVSFDKIHRKYQNEIQETIPKALKQGIRGWQVCDAHITLIDGEDHEVHSRPGDFILATHMGIMQALKNAETKLLEPLQAFEIKADELFLGQISGDLNQMRAQIEPPQFEGNRFTLKGLIPTSESLDYSIKFQSITKGKGSLRLRFGKYAECPEGFGKDRSYRGVNPLDRSQWILHHRGAFKADERQT